MLKNQKATVMMTDIEEDKEKWSKKVRDRMREGRAEKRGEIESNVKPCTSNFP